MKFSFKKIGMTIICLIIAILIGNSYLFNTVVSVATSKEHKLNLFNDGALPSVITEDTYLVTGTYNVASSGLYITAGVTLEVEAGTIIIGSNEIIVDGQLLLNGEENGRIEFQNTGVITVGASGTIDAAYVDFLDINAPLPSSNAISSSGVIKLDNSTIVPKSMAIQLAYRIFLFGNIEITNSEINMPIYIGNNTSEVTNLIIEDNILSKGMIIGNKPLGTFIIKNNVATSYNYILTLPLEFCGETAFEDIKNNVNNIHPEYNAIMLTGSPTTSINLKNQNFVFGTSLTIPVNTVFEVDAGISLKIGYDNYSGALGINVDGQLLFNGTEDKRITLEAEQSNNKWGPINISATGLMEASYTDFIKIANNVYTNMGPAINNKGILKLDNCTVTGSPNVGINGYLISSGDDISTVANHLEITNSNIDLKIQTVKTNNVIIEDNIIEKGLVFGSYKPTGVLKVKNNVATGNYYPVTISLSICDEDTFTNIINNVNATNVYYNATNVTESPTTDIKLTKQNYIFNNSFTIPVATTFEVEAGSIIGMKYNTYALDNYNITVNGTLKLIGDSEQPVLITSMDELSGNTPTGYWSGIKINSTGYFSAEDAIISRAGTTSTYSIENYGSLRLVNSVIQNCKNNGAIRYNTQSPIQLLRNNAILGNVTSNIELDALYNFWGHESGPRRNVNGIYVGIGASVSDNIHVEPFNETFERTGARIETYGFTPIYEQRHFGKLGLDAFSGNYGKQYVDLGIANNNIDLNFTRTYNSKNKNEDILGAGWTFGFSSRVENIYNQNSYIVYLPDGSIDVFNKQGSAFYSFYSRNMFKIENNKYVLTFVNQTVYTYSINGKLESIADKYGNATLIIRDSNGTITSIKDAVNRVYLLQYNNENKLVKITDPIGRYVTYGYDNNDMLTTVTNVSGVVTSYIYNANRQLISIKENNVVKEIIEYIASGTYEERVYKKTDENGNATTYMYDQTNRITTETDSNNYVTKKYFDKDGYITKIIDPLNKQTLITYNLVGGVNKYGEQLTYTDINTNKTTYQRDTSGKIIKITNPDNSTKTYTYNNKNNIIKEIDELNHVTEYIYDNSGVKLQKVVKPLDGVTLYNPSNNPDFYEIVEYSYYSDNIEGLIKTKTDDKGTTTYEYDTYGNISKVTLDSGDETIYTNNALGWVLSERINNGYITTYEYNDFGSLKKTIKDSNIISEIVYNYQNKPIKVIDGNESFETIQYDKAGNIVKQIDKNGNITNFNYDVYGNLVKKINPNGSIYLYTYDKLNRLVKTNFMEYDNAPITLLEEKTYTNASSYTVVTKTYKTASTFKTKTEKYNYLNKLIYSQNETQTAATFTYTLNGLLSKETTANGETINYYYNNTNRLEKMYKLMATNEYAATFYVYDNYGRLIQEKVGEENVSLNATPNTFGVTTIGYNDIGQAISKSTTSGEYITYEYDDNNNVVLINTRINQTQNQVKEYEYNYLNKLIKESNGDIVVNYQYDGVGNVIKEAIGDRVLEYVYDNKGNVVEKILNGITLEEVVYDNMDNIISKVDGKGNINTYSYDKRGNVLSETNGNLKTTTYTYDLIGRITSSTNPNNTLTTYTYNLFDDIANKTIGNTISHKYTYDYNSNVLSYTNPELKATTYTYDKSNNLLTVKDARNGITSYKYDGASRVIEENNAKNQITLYTYDERGNLIKKSIKETVSSQEVILEEYTYDLLNNVTTKKDGNLNITNYEYNEKGQLIKITNPLGYIQEYIYNEYGEVTLITDNLDKEIIREYDDRGNVILEREQNIDASEAIEVLKTYDNNNNLIEEVDGNGNISSYQYDSLNNVVSIINPKGQEVTYVYDDNNNLIEETNHLGNSKTYVYDIYDRLISKKNELDEVIEELEYDKNGRQVKSIDANGYVYTFIYDEVGNLVQKIDELGGVAVEKNTYDLLGNVTFKYDKKQNLTKYVYDINQNLIKVTNALNEVTTYLYDLNNNLIKVTDGRGKVTEYTYNSLNNELTEKDALANIEYKEYYINGLLSKRITRNTDVIDYTYDIHGRLIEENDISYVYDNNSNLLEVNNENNETIRSYDELDRVISKEESSLISTYVYDIDGYKEKTTDPKGNIVIKEYDKVGRLKDVNSEVEYEYNVDGTLKKLTYANGVIEEYYYNQDKTLNKLININDDIIEEYRYEYDLNKNIIKEITPEGIRISTYDNLNRIKTVNENGVTTTYTYDAGGNRTREVRGLKSKDYVYDNGNRLVQTTEKNNGFTTSVITYTNDNNGNLLTTLESNVVIEENIYNERNELVSTTKDNKTTTYSYNAEGRRISKISGTSTTRFIYEGASIILEVDESNDEIASNVYGHNLVTRNIDNVRGYYLYNGHGDTVTIVDTNGTILNTYEYDSFGVITSETGTFDNPYRYSGYYYDIESDNYYLMSRYYNPSIARFISEDTYRGTLDDPLSLNRYVYVHNNPLIYYDPDGYFLREVGKFFAGTAKYVGLRTLALLDGSGELVDDTFSGVFDFAITVSDTITDEIWFLTSTYKYLTGGMDEAFYLRDLKRIEENLGENLGHIVNIPVNVIVGVANNVTYTFDPRNIVNYLTTDSYDEIKDYSKSAIQTGMTLYGGYKLAKGAINVVKSVEIGSVTAPLFPMANASGTLSMLGVRLPVITGVDTALLNQALIEMGTGASSVVSGNINNKQRKGTPRNNRVQNKQVDDIVKKYNLSKAQRRVLHDEITGQNLTFKEVESIAFEIKNGNY